MKQRPKNNYALLYKSYVYNIKKEYDKVLYNHKRFMHEFIKKK